MRENREKRLSPKRLAEVVLEATNLVSRGEMMSAVWIMTSQVPECQRGYVLAELKYAITKLQEKERSVKCSSTDN